MMKSLASLICISMVASCVTPQEETAAPTALSVRMWHRTVAGEESSVALTEKNGQFEGVEIVTALDGSQVKKNVSYPLSIASFPRQVQTDAQGAFVEYEQHRTPVKVLERSAEHFAAELTLPGMAGATFELDGQVKHNFLIPIAIAIVVGAYACADAVQYSMRKCEEKGGSPKWSYAISICSGSCTFR